jgi:hypothetical protein
LVNLSTSSLLVLFAAILLAAIVVIWYAGTRLADHHGSDLRIVWYLFSLSSLCTLIAAAWASSVGAIDPSGSFQGGWGKAIEAFLKFMLDLDTDVKLFATILAVVVLPQMTSYLLSGLFGCASSPILIGRAFALFVWSTVKSFVVASGILLTVAIYGGGRGWVAWNLKGAVSMSLLSLMLLVLSFGCLYLYRDIGNTMALPASGPGLRVQRRLNLIRAWLTRKEVKSGAA